MENTRWQHSDWTLLWVMAVYCVLNFLNLVMGPLGLLPIGAIFDVFYFWTFIAPAIMCLGVFAYQIGADRRPFTWAGVLIFAIVISAVGYLNLNLFANAAGSV